MKKKDDLDTLLNFFTEAELLKRVKRSGWWMIGIKDPESVAEHSFRTAILGQFLAHYESADPYKVMTMCLYNDIHESRINDLHKVGHKYIAFKDAEKRVRKDQFAAMPSFIKKDVEKALNEMDEQMTREAIVARDADLLECMLQGKEYYDRGNKAAKEFFGKPAKLLRTKTAKKLYRKMLGWSSLKWWDQLKKLER
jgi:putative hydrolase of HD superfamily